MIDITQLINEQEEVRDRRKSERFHLSRIGLCLRKTFYNMTEEVEANPHVDYDKLRMFRIANFIEEDLRRLFEKAGILFSYQYKLTEHIVPTEEVPFFSGILDFLIYKDGRFSVVELKTAHPNLMNYTDKFPKDYNVSQARHYAWALKNMGIDISSYILYYMSRGGSTTPLQYDFEWSDEDEKKVLSDHAVIKEAWNSYIHEGILQPHPKEVTLKKKSKKGEPREDYVYISPSWECGYCEYQGYACCPDMENKLIGTKTNDGINFKEGVSDGDKNFCKESIR